MFNYSKKHIETFEEKSDETSVNLDIEYDTTQHINDEDLIQVSSEEGLDYFTGLLKTWEDKGKENREASLETFQFTNDLLTSSLDNYSSNDTKPTVLAYCPVSAYNKETLEPIPLNAKITGVLYKAYLTSSITEINKYLTLLEVLNKATKDDLVYIYIDSPGGQINSGVTICSAIDKCDAHVVTIATGMCASAGSLILAAGHEIKVYPTATLMWHMSSHMGIGNSLTIKHDTDNQINFVKNVLLQASVDKKLITSEEVEQICTNPEYTLWLTPDEIKTRLGIISEDLL